MLHVYDEDSGTDPDHNPIRRIKLLCDDHLSSVKIIQGPPKQEKLSLVNALVRLKE